MPRRARGIEIKSGPPCVCVRVSHCTHTFHLFHLVNFLFTLCPSLYSSWVWFFFEIQSSFREILIVPLILLCVFIAPFAKLETAADKPITIQ